MKKLLVFPLLAALVLVVSCQKQQSEEEKKAEVERLVKERLAAAHLTDEKQRLAQVQADLESREKALAEKEAAAAAVAKTTRETPIQIPQTVREAPDSEPRSAASYGTFYQKLEPYGAWRETSEYGYVWQPREAEESRDWRPYTDGRWVFTNAGWTWVSEEAFGWATYHYGRWVRLRRVGWVWVPGDEWAPAWVSWRTSREYVGWAPLPPEARFDRRSGIRNWADNYYDIGPDQYAFVPGNEFGSRRLQGSVLPVERNVTIVTETTNVTNITYTNTTIINLGPNYEEMRSRSRQPIERYRLERETNSETAAPPIVRGDALVVSGPTITNVFGIDRPQVKETITQATVEKTWAPNSDPSSSERAREKMKAEAMPPSNAPSKTFVKPAVTTPAGSGHGPVPVKTVSVPPTPAPTAVATPVPIAVATPAPTARPTPAAIATPSAPTPSVRPAIPAPTARPAITTPAVSPRSSATLDRAPQPTPQRALPTPMLAPPPRAIRVQPTPTAAAPPRAISIQPPKAVVRPTPAGTLSAKPLAPPRVPPPVVTPPVKVAPVSSAPPQIETNPAVRPTPPTVRPKQPAPVPAPPISRAESSPIPKGKKADVPPRPLPTAIPK